MSWRSRSAHLLNSFWGWLVANLVIYSAIAVPLQLVYIYVSRSGLSRTVGDYYVEIALTFPANLAIMIVPTVIFLTVLWNVRPARSVWFRLVAFLLLAVPCVFAQDHDQLLFIAGVQVIFSQVMIKSRPKSVSPFPADSPRPKPDHSLWSHDTER